MPAHNEADFLMDSVTEIVAGLTQEAEDYTILVVENGSTDKTMDVIQGLVRSVPQFRYVTLPVADYGTALRTGVLEAQGDQVVIFDVDFFDLDFLQQAVDWFSSPDPPAIIVGSKRAVGAHDARPFTRRLATATFTWLLRTVLGLKVHDTHGIKALHRPQIAELAAQCHSGRDLWDTELILRAERAGLRVVEVPVSVEERRPARSSIFQRVPRTLWGMAKLRVSLWRHSGRTR